MCVVGSPASLEPNSYWRLAENLLRYGTLGFNGLKSTAYEPLYPLFLALARWLTQDNLFLVLVLQIAVASVGCVYFRKLCDDLSGSRLVGWMGILLFSFYPYLVHQTVGVSEVSLFATLLILTAYFYVKATDLKGSFLAGIFFALTLLLRITALPIALLAMAALLLRRRFRDALVICGVSFLALASLALRNYFLDGTILLSRSGHNLFAANCELSDQLVPFYSLDLTDPYTYGILEKEASNRVGMKESEFDKFFHRKAIEFMRKHPGRTLRLRLLNLFYFFHPRIVPFFPMREKKPRLVIQEDGGFHIEDTVRRPPVAEWLHSMTYGFILATSLAGIFQRRREFKKDAILYCILATLALVYSFYEVSTRRRAPADFVPMFYSACALERARDRLKALSRSLTGRR